MTENHVTYRGSMKDTNIIQLPAESISIQLTPIGGYQELFVEKLEWAQRVIVKTASASKIHCYYTINATLL